MRERNKYLKEQKLHEQVTGDGITFLGNYKEYDLYRATTYAGLNTFLNDDGDPIGYMIQNETTFNSHINDIMHFYVITKNSNDKVVYGILSNAGNKNIHVRDLGDINWNLTFEDCFDVSVTEIDSNIFKLINWYIDTPLVGNNLNNNFISDLNESNCLIRYIPELNAESINITIPSEFTKIGDKAFSDCEVNTIVNIPATVVEFSNSAFWHNTDIEFKVNFEISSEEAPEGDWIDLINDSDITWEYNSSPEQTQARQAARIEALKNQIISNLNNLIDNIPDPINPSNECKQEIDNAINYLNSLNQTQSELVPDELRTLINNKLNEFNVIKRDEEQRKVATTFKYKIYKKNEIEITFINPKRFKFDDSYYYEIEIPDEIEGKPVTRIAPYAFVVKNLWKTGYEGSTCYLKLTGGRNLKFISANSFNVYMTWEFYNSLTRLTRNTYVFVNGLDYTNTDDNTVKSKNWFKYITEPEIVASEQD